MDCQASGKNGQIKINTGEGGKTERDSEKIELFHRRIYDAVTRLKELQGYKAQSVLTF